MKVRIPILVPVLMTATMLSMPWAAVAASFQNGSFENPGVGPGGFLDIGTVAQAPTGWIPSGTLGNAALFYEGNGTFGTPSQDGVNMIGFGGNGRTGAVLSQTFDTVVARSYTVSFFVTAQQLGSGPQSYSAEVFDGTSSLGSDSGSIPVALNWVGHSFNFVATGAASTLSFTDTSNGAAAAGINWALDNVTVSGVPEPRSLGLMAAGLAALAFVCKARRRA
jgi:hypothetical protein